jgi:hypothetical protein
VNLSAQAYTDSNLMLVERRDDKNNFGVIVALSLVEWRKRQAASPF